MFKRIYADISDEVDQRLQEKAKAAGMSKKAYLEKLINDDAAKGTKKAK